MINLTYEQIVEKINNNTNTSREEIELKIDGKLKELNDLISKEGAAHIIANEFGVKLFDAIPLTLKVKDVIAGMKSINLLAKVLTIYPVREFKKENRSGRVLSLLIGDETGIMRLVIWDENQIIQLKDLKEGDIIKARNVYSKLNGAYKELHSGNRSQIIVNPPGEIVKEVLVRQEIMQKQIKDLSENDFVKAVGSIVQVFDPKFYEICPECGKRARLDGQGFLCIEHGEIAPKLVPVINFFFDDGTGVVRVVCFRKQVEQLLNIKEEDLAASRDDPVKIEDIKKQILLKQIAIEGRVSKNVTFDRIEFIANKVNELNPDEVIASLQNKKNDV